MPPHCLPFPRSPLAPQDPSRELAICWLKKDSFVPKDRSKKEKEVLKTSVPQFAADPPTVPRQISTAPPINHPIVFVCSCAMCENSKLARKEPIKSKKEGLPKHTKQKALGRTADRSELTALWLDAVSLLVLTSARSRASSKDQTHKKVGSNTLIEVKTEKRSVRSFLGVPRFKLRLSLPPCASPTRARGEIAGWRRCRESQRCGSCPGAWGRYHGPCCPGWTSG